MGALFIGGLKAAFLKILGAILTRSMMEWLLFYVAELIVESTKTPHDNRLLKKVKEAVNETAS